MVRKIRSLLEKYWDILAYLFFGVCTTVVNYIVYLPCYNLLQFSATVSNILAWVVAVMVVILNYIGSKLLVFTKK